MTKMNSCLLKLSFSSSRAKAAPADGAEGSSTILTRLKLSFSSSRAKAAPADGAEGSRDFCT